MDNILKAEQLFNETLRRHTQLMEYEEQLESNSEAIPYLEEIIEDYTSVLRLSSTQKSTLFNRGLVSQTLAKIYINFERSEKALELLDSAMSDFVMATHIDKNYTQAYIYGAMSNYIVYEIYTKMGKDDLALQHLRYVDDEYQIALSIAQPNEKELIRARYALILFDLAEIYWKQNEDKALKYFQRSIDISPNNDQEAIYNTGLAYYKIALIYLQKKEHALALKALEHANEYNFKLLNDIKSLDLLDTISKSMVEIARIYEHWSDYQKAIVFYKDAIKYFNKILLTALKEFDALGSVAILQSDIAKLYYLVGQSRESKEFYTQSIKALKKFLSFYPNEVIAFNHLSIAYNALANIYRYEMVKSQDRTFEQKAKYLYLQADHYYSKASKIDSSDIATLLNQAGNYSDLGEFYIYIKNNSESIEVLKQSLVILEQVLEVNNSYPQTLNNMNINRLRLAEAYKRESQLECALKVLKANNAQPTALNRAEVGRIYLLKGDKDKALSYFDNAMKEYLLELERDQNSLIVLENISLLIEEILQVSNKRYYVDRAIEYNQKIISVYDQYFIDIGFEDDAFSVTQKMSIALERLLDVYVMSGKKADGSLVDALETLKSKRLKQLMANHLSSNIDFSKEYQTKFAYLQSKLKSVRRELKKEEVVLFMTTKQKKLYEEFQDYSQQLSKLLSLYHESRENIFERLSLDSVILYPIYYGEKLTVVSVQKVMGFIDINISQKVIKNDIKFSAYFIFIKEIEALFDSNRDLSTKDIENINNIAIDEEIKQYIFHQDENGSYNACKIDAYEFAVEYKYKIIQIALSHTQETIVELIPKGVTKQILFAPFGELSLLPLHSIYLQEEGQYLIEKYQISYIPSLSLLPQLQNRDLNNNLFISTDEFEEEGEYYKLFVENGHTISDIDTVQFKVRVDNQKYNIVHISTHGFSDLNNPFNSYLEFKKSVLSLLQIHGLKLDINLVVLSACETYLGTLQGADEVLAFERALLIAGARSIVSTFSTVDISNAHDFMTTFYKNYTKHKSISKTFQEACIEDISNGSMEWSLFRLMGT